jgi:hypothetical protein
MMLDLQKRDTFLTYSTCLKTRKSKSMPCVFVACDLSMSYEFKAGAASSTANNAHCEAGAGAAAYVSPQPCSRKRSTLFSRMEEELVVPSPLASGVAPQLLPDTVDIERRMYETVPKSDLTAGMVKGEDGRN